MNKEDKSGGQGVWDVPVGHFFTCPGSGRQEKRWRTLHFQESATHWPWPPVPITSNGFTSLFCSRSAIAKEKREREMTRSSGKVALAA